MAASTRGRCRRACCPLLRRAAADVAPGGVVDRHLPVGIVGVMLGNLQALLLYFTTAVTL